MSKITQSKTFLAVCAFVLSGLFVSAGAAQANPNAMVETVVRVTFPDAPDMITIANCESGMRQYNASGSVLMGGAGGKYVGVFQIAQSLHSAKALSMGYDINTIEGNIAYARVLYQASGTNPWKSCLPSSPTPAPVDAPAANSQTSASPSIYAPASPASAIGVLTANLNIGMTNDQVLILQKILNNSGFSIASSGPGAPGQETNYFGNLTREAVKRFQCAKQIACSGNESTTGYGRVGPMTRSAINQ